jgi:hypothetical protein
MVLARLLRAGRARVAQRLGNVPTVVKLATLRQTRSEYPRVNI